LLLLALALSSSSGGKNLVLKVVDNEERCDEPDTVGDNEISEQVGEGVVADVCEAGVAIVL